MSGIVTTSIVSFFCFATKTYKLCDLSSIARGRSEQVIQYMGSHLLLLIIDYDDDYVSQP